MSIWNKNTNMNCGEVSVCNMKLYNNFKPTQESRSCEYFNINQSISQSINTEGGKVNDVNLLPLTLFLISMRRPQDLSAGHDRREQSFAL